MAYIGLILLVAVAAWLPSPLSGYRSFQNQVPNGGSIPHPCKQGETWPGLGHLNPNGGGERNSFGLDFRAAGYTWTQQLCLQDSDDDGKTNGQELGDPFCVWTPGAVPARTTNITHPGVCDPLDKPWCEGRTDFVDCSSEDEFDSCTRIQAPDVRSLTITFPEMQVPPTETNYYCMTFDLPSDQDYHMIASEPIITNADVMHHMLLFGCNDDSSLDIRTPQRCDMASTETDACRDVIAIWSVGITGTCLKDDVAFRFGASSYKKVLLQHHWNNPWLSPDFTDASGMRLYYRQALPGVNDLFTFWIGQMILNIPPEKTEVTFTGTCPSECSRQIFNKRAYITNVYNHMHYMGRKSRAELYRNGVKIRDLGIDEVYSYDSPVNHKLDPPAEVLPGDELRLMCSFSSEFQDRYVYFGDGTADEMCLSFLTMYPKDAVVGKKECLQYGVVSECQLDAQEPVNGCDWAGLAGVVSPADSDLHRNCNLNGFCRPECLEVVERLSRHPCLVPGQPMTAFVHWLFQQIPEGVRFLGLYHSCSAHVGKPRPGDSDTCSKDKCGC